jgi:hypothetical protein
MLPIKATSIGAYLSPLNFAFGMIASLPLIPFGATIGFTLITTRSRCAVRRDKGFDIGKAWLAPIPALSLN